ncbi:MAG: fasciclin domain-containing protein [Rhodothermales bacterium]|nr:fasciclin domain-containing protein [Rhodothermales bacterium]
MKRNLLHSLAAILAFSAFTLFGFQSQPAPSTDDTIVEVAASADDFSTLVAAVKAAGLVETLSSEGPFTVFAPTNAAFAALPEGTVEELLKPENKDKLTAILTYHVVPGKVTSGEVVKLDSAPTANGKALDIAVKNGTVMVNNATVTTVDIPASNGVIHVIDTVLLPPMDTKKKHGY